jgi:competence protein ComEC
VRGSLEGALAWLAGRPLCGAAAAFGLGIGLFHVSPDLPVLLLLALSAVGVVVGAAASRLAPGFSVLLVLLGFLAAGAAASELRATTRGAQNEEIVELLDGTVLGEPRLDDGRTRFLFGASRALRDGTWKEVSFASRLSINDRVELDSGDRVRLKARLRPPDPPLNPGSPDTRKRLRAAGIAVVGTVVERQLALIGTPHPLFARVERFRQGFRELVGAAAPAAEPSALLLALALGDRASIGDETNEDFSRSGLAHILSVSGLHIAIVAAGLYRLLRWLLARSEYLLLRTDARAVASLCAIPATWIYVAFTGAEIPAVRSGVMATALFLAMAAGRDQDGPSALAAALLAVLAYDPSAITSLSFRLSFAAVAGLLLLTRPLRRIVPLAPPRPDAHGIAARLLRAREALLLAAATSCAASLATAPLVAEAFQRASLVAVLANAVAMPVATALTILSATSALAFSFSDTLAALLVVLAEPLARLLLWLSHAFASLPFASMRVASPSPLGLCAWFALLSALPLLHRRRRTALRLLAGSVLVLAFLGAHQRLAPLFRRELSATFLAVGNGDATLLRLPGGRALLVDGGGDPAGRWDVGTRVVAPALLELSVHELDAAVLSHPHPDHALGLISVLKQVPARELWVARAAEGDGLLRTLTSLAAERGMTVRRLAAGDSIADFAPLRIEVLHPPASTELSGNDASLVLRVTFGKHAILLTGDIERAGEQQVLESSAPGATVLKAPHHGSRTSSSEAFVRAVAPEHVVFSAGRGGFGFPHRTVVERYERIGAQMHQTALHGAITFHTDGSQLRVERFAESTLPPTARATTSEEAAPRGPR